VIISFAGVGDPRIPHTDSGKATEAQVCGRSLHGVGLIGTAGYPAVWHCIGQARPDLGGRPPGGVSWEVGVGPVTIRTEGMFRGSLRGRMAHASY